MQITLSSPNEITANSHIVPNYHIQHNTILRNSTPILRLNRLSGLINNRFGHIVDRTAVHRVSVIGQDREYVIAFLGFTDAGKRPDIINKAGLTKYPALIFRLFEIFADRPVYPPYR